MPKSKKINLTQTQKTQIAAEKEILDKLYTDILADNYLKTLNTKEVTALKDKVEKQKKQENIVSYEEYLNWMKVQKDIFSIQHVIYEKLSSAMEDKYLKNRNPEDHRRMENVLEEILNKKQTGQKLTDAEQKIKCADDFEKVKNLHAKLDNFNVSHVLNFTSVMIPHFESYMKKLEGYGHHEQWKAMKQALQNAKSMISKLPEDPAQARRSLLSTMNLLQMTAQNYADYKAKPGLKGTDLKRKEMAENLAKFAADQASMLESAVASCDQADYIGEAEFEAYAANVRNPLNVQQGYLNNLCDKLRLLHTDSLPEAYKTMRVRLAMYSARENDAYNAIVKKNGNAQNNWKIRNDNIADLSSKVNDCIESLKTSSKYSEKDMERLRAVLELRNYLNNLQKAEEKKREFEERANKVQKFREAAEQVREELKKHLFGKGAMNEIAPADFKKTDLINRSSCYKLYVAGLYERAVLRRENGQASDRDNAVLDAVETGKGIEYAMKLMRNDRDNPESITAKWFGVNTIQYQTVKAMFSKKDTAEIVEKISRNELPREENVNEFFALAESCRQHLRTTFMEDGVFSKEKYANAIGNKDLSNKALAESYALLTSEIMCVYISAVYESLPKEGGTPLQNEIRELVKSGKAKELMDPDNREEFLKSLPNYENLMEAFSVQEVSGKINLRLALDEKNNSKLVNVAAMYVEMKKISSEDKIEEGIASKITDANRAEFSELASMLYTGYLYIAAKQMKEPTKKANVIIDLMENYGLEACKKKLMECDKTMKDMFTPENLTEATLRLVREHNGLKKLIKEHLGNAASPEKIKVQPNVKQVEVPEMVPVK